jgi:uncharacterized protein YndB with AHSA1/START domain
MDNELTIKRIFDAPRELVFKAWTDPTLLAKWWGPTYFTIPACEVDARPGGKLYIVMHGPKGTVFDVDMPIHGMFQEFVPPSRLVFNTDAVEDEKGVPQLRVLCTASFSEAGGKTELTLHLVLQSSNPASQAAWAGSEMGWNQSLDKLAMLQVKA